MHPIMTCIVSILALIGCGILTATFGVVYFTDVCKREWASMVALIFAGLTYTALIVSTVFAVLAVGSLG